MVVEEPRPDILHKPLERAPISLPVTVRDLVARVADGRIRVPNFQRPLRWRAEDVVKLFDSVLRGYPVGALLFWRHPFEAGEVTVGGAVLAVSATTDGWYIVDGQQRTTALAAALLELNHQADKRWKVSYWPDTRAFASDAERTPVTGKSVPLSVLGDLRRLGRWFRDCTLSEVEQQDVERVQQRILDYSLPAYLMETEDPEPLRGVFARLNSSGVGMRAVEVFDALLGKDADATASRPASLLDRLQSACDLDYFGLPPREEVLKALLAMSGHDPSKRLEKLGETAASTLVPEADVTTALRRTVAFLQAPHNDPELPGAGIPTYAFLPYPVVFAILAKWFHVFPEPDFSTRQLLSRWVWRGVSTGVHQRAAVSEMRDQVASIKENDLQGSLNRLLRAVASETPVRWDLRPFSSRSATSRVELLTLLTFRPQDANRPVHWRSLLQAGERVAREVLHAQKQENLGENDRKLARTVANRVLLDSRSSGLDGEFRTWKWPKHRERIESHAMDETSFGFLLAKDHAAFLHYRAERIRTEVTAFLHARTGFDAPTYHPIGHYLDVDGHFA